MCNEGDVMNMWDQIKMKLASTLSSESFQNWVAGATHKIESLIVGENEEHIGLPGGCLNRHSQKKCCRQQDDQTCHAESLGVHGAGANGIAVNFKGLV